MTRKLIAICALLAGLFVLAGPVGPASAGGPSDYADCIVTVSDTDLEAGDEVDVSGSGLQPNFETDIIFDRGEDTEEVLATVTTDANGEFGPITVTIPNVPDGEHSISMACDSTTVNSTTVTVGGVTLEPPAPLPRTGSDVEPLVVAGGAAILAGVAFVVVAKRRRRSVSA
jgi:LPXTG-motif cell wall-anchored protein